MVARESESAPCTSAIEFDAVHIIKEELEVPYMIKKYKRQPSKLAPPELFDIHPLGKSPVITDDGLVIAESGAIVGETTSLQTLPLHRPLTYSCPTNIVEYLIEKYDKPGKFKPSADGTLTNKYCKHWPKNAQ